MLEKSVSGMTNVRIYDEYTTQTVFYLLISFRHRFIILICIFNHYNLIHFFALVVCACCFMQNGHWRHISTIYVNNKHGKVCLSNVASGLDVHSSSCLVIFLPQSWYGRDWKMTTTGHPSQCPESICLSAYFNIKFWYF